MADAFYTFGPREGERHEARGSVMLFKAMARTTNGRLSLMERTLPPGVRMSPPHAHVGMEEGFFVLEGQVTFLLNGAEQTRGP
ncbi:MAG: cupin domain-containing protein [Chloroflexota bacterium]|nr:cupin domain-containing protein [Chloroflexota bacterium]